MKAEIDYSVDYDTAIITLNRPETHNAFTLDMIDQWPGLFRRADADPGINAIILTGAGGTFCSGIDLAELAAVEREPSAYKSMLTDRIHQVALTLQTIDKPVIAAMDGRAVGAGLDMALMCDMRVASTGATMSEGYVKIGLVPGDGGGYFLPRLVGEAKALELLLTGDFIAAEEALRIGMINRLVETPTALDGALDLARSIARHPQDAVHLIKRTVRQSAQADLRTALDLVSSHFGILACSEDTQAIMDRARK